MKPRIAHGTALSYYKDVVLKYDGDECLFWPFSTDGKGGAKLQFNGRVRRVSRLVCEERNGPAPAEKMDAAHSCGKGHLGCVTGRHLSWKTHADNALDMHVHGTSQRGEKQWGCKLTEPQVLEIAKLRGKVLQRDLADRFRVSRITIGDIQTGRTWAWFTGVCRVDARERRALSAKVEAA